MGEISTITILGHFSVRGGEGIDAAPSAPKERKVLALLLFNYCHVVPVHVLVDELWGDDPPKRARTALQTYILNLRGRLAQSLGRSTADIRDDVLVTRSEGYQFQLRDCYFDLHDYLGLVTLGESAVHEDDDAKAAEVLRRAERLWTGTVLPDVDHGLPLQAEVAQLEQRRLAAQALRIESELRLGRDRELVGELSRLALRSPYDERLHEYLMLCLSRLGRRVQALEVFHRLRTSLVQELGMEPSLRTQKLHRDILESAAMSL
ncbi:AfsR/SARP family transcriptional regulator [Dactylosporangium vinaceum]|uniref:BTAD domain-containing putative transcriptional regulator n=1 Tax=Dactylosporangium vinaceum TaxID=53362 RepID=A0ABV5M386_9ACTN|nr:AfsR/SARP family transcriptional regulator [Dactylosporangium vinaceum]UAB99744.1 AfsR/SARP family transcriptional regulator [Dactylosporangium vinaceum]